MSHMRALLASIYGRSREKRDVCSHVRCCSFHLPKWECAREQKRKKVNLEKVGEEAAAEKFPLCQFNSI